MNERDRTDIWERTDTSRDTGVHTAPAEDYPGEYRRASESDVRGKSPAQLEDEIDRIRQEMNATLSAIERRFSPGEILDRTLHSLRGGPGEYAANLGHSIKDNPIPATLIGIGLGWLMMGERRESYPTTGETIGRRTGLAREKVGAGMESARERMEETKGRVSETSGRMKEKVGEMKHAVSEKMHHATEKMHQTREQAGERMHSMRERAGHARDGLSERGHRTGERVHEMRSSVTDFAHEQPLLLGLIGLGVGALVAAMLPPTRQEDALMGEASDRMKEQAKETGREQMEKARQVAEASAQTAREETERQLH